MPTNVQTYIGRMSAWHNLGTVTGKYQTWAEILAHGGLDFDVIKDQLEYQGVKVASWGVFRKNHGENGMTLLGNVGEDYKVINHAQGFEMVDALMGTADGAHYETAGVLGEGETVWGLADLGLTAYVGDDLQKGYLLFATGHTGNMTYQFRICMERVVCQNTLNIALSQGSQNVFRVKHTRNAQNRIADAHMALERLQGDVQSMERKLQMLATKRVTRESLDKVMLRLFPVKKDAEGKELESSTRRSNIMADILSIYEQNDGDVYPEQRGTAYNLLNAVTNYTDHVRSTHGDMRAESAMFGSGDKMKTMALDCILAEAEKMQPMAQYRPSIQADSEVFQMLKVRN